MPYSLLSISPDWSSTTVYWSTEGYISAITKIPVLRELFCKCSTACAVLQNKYLECMWREGISLLESYGPCLKFSSISHQMLLPHAVEYSADAWLVISRQSKIVHTVFCLHRSCVLKRISQEPYITSHLISWLAHLFQVHILLITIEASNKHAQYKTQFSTALFARINSLLAGMCSNHRMSISTTGSNAHYSSIVQNKLSSFAY